MKTDKTFKGSKPAGFLSRKGKAAVISVALIAVVGTGAILPRPALAGLDMGAVVAAIVAMQSAVVNVVQDMVKNWVVTVVQNEVRGHTTATKTFKMAPGMPQLNTTQGQNSLTNANSAQTNLNGSNWSQAYGMNGSSSAYAAQQNQAVSQWQSKRDGMWNFTGTSGSGLVNATQLAVGASVQSPGTLAGKAGMMADYRAKTAMNMATQGAAGIEMANSMQQKYGTVDPTVADNILSDQTQKDRTKMMYDSMLIQIQMLRILSAQAMSK